MEVGGIVGTLAAVKEYAMNPRKPSSVQYSIVPTWKVLTMKVPYRGRRDEHTQESLSFCHVLSEPEIIECIFPSVSDAIFISLWTERS